MNQTLLPVTNSIFNNDKLDLVINHDLNLKDMVLLQLSAQLILSFKIVIFLTNLIC